MLEVIHYEPASPEQLQKGKIIGYVDIKVPYAKSAKMIIRKIAHFQDGEKRWFNLTAFKRNEKYLKYWEFENSSHNGQLLEKLPDLVKKFCDENKIKTHQPPPQLNFNDQMDCDDVPF